MFYVLFESLWGAIKKKGTPNKIPLAESQDILIKQNW